MEPIVSFGGTFLLEWLRERHRRHHAIEDHISSIQDELRVLAQCIELHQSARGEMKTRVDRWRKLAYDTEVCIRRYTYNLAMEFRRRQRMPRHVRFLRPGDRLRSRFALKLEGLKANLVAATTDAAKQSPPAAAPEPEEPDVRLLGDTVGMANPCFDLLELVLPHEDQRGNFKVISILGPGGVGKTLLSSIVYKAIEDRDPHEFPRRASVRAADKDIDDVLRDILREIHVVEDDIAAAAGCTGGLSGLLNSSLRGTRYLIMIDDMRKPEQWDKIKSSFPDGYASRVIVTTRNPSVANVCSTDNGYVYKMRPLNESDSECLFISEANLQYDPGTMVEVSVGLRMKCDGLPLALVSVARYVRMKRGQEDLNNFCKEVCMNLGEYLETDKLLERMQWVLARPFDSLDGYTYKASLLYFCTFNCAASPIRRNHMMRRWIAEGFVNPEPGREGSCMIEQLHKWQTLIDQNLITPTDVSNNYKVKRCQPSGMVLEYISHKSKVENLVAFLGEVPHPEYTRWLSLHNGTGRYEYALSNFPRSRPVTLVVSGRAGDGVLSFANCELLRVLDLEDCTDLEDRQLEKICDMLLLRYLGLGMSVTRVPRKIAKLQFLETLDLKKTNIHAIPLEVILLPRLKHLLGRFQLRNGDYKSNRSVESNLETLAGFIVGTNKGFPQLMHLMKKLRKVKIWCNSNADPTNMSALSESIRKFLFGWEEFLPAKNQSLSIDFEDCSQHFLDSLSYPSQQENRPCVLESLKLSGRGEQLNRILTIVTKLECITELCLLSTNQMEVSWVDLVSRLETLRLLQYLKLVAHSIRGFSFWIEGRHFPGLKRMCLQVEENLPRIYIGPGALKFLESLHLICRRLDDLSAAEIGRLHMLKEVAIHSEVSEQTRRSWTKAAGNHPKRPTILFVDIPRPA
ncbi:hypothetical protein ACP70R_019056 [Stipagrostis hirtigluma subsp. patula]